MMLELVYDRVTTGVNRAIRKGAVLRFGENVVKVNFTFPGYSLSKKPKTGRDASSGEKVIRC
jgi:hypothetical protein